MTRYAGNEADVVLKRAYAYGGIAHDKSLVIQILSLCQRTMNAYLGDAIHDPYEGSPTANFTPSVSKQVYNLRQELPSALDIISIHEDITTTTVPSYRRVPKSKGPNEIAAYDDEWFRQTGSYTLAWTQIGRDFFLLYPAPTATPTVARHFVTYSLITTELSNDSDAFQTSDKVTDLVVDLGELVVLARDKQLTSLKTKAETLLARLGLRLGNEQGKSA